MMARRLYLVLLLLLTAAAAQAPASGSGAQAVVTLQGGADSNLRNNNLERLSGMQYELSSLLNYAQQGPRGGWNVQYQPFVQWFSQAPELDSLNQLASLQGHWSVEPRWTVSGQASGGYVQILPGEVLSGLQPLLGQTTLIATPRSREVTGAAELGLAYHLSPRMQAFASGSFNDIRFPGSSTSGLTGVRQDQGQAGLSWTISPRTQFGVETDYTNASLGSSSHLAAASLMVNWQRRMTPATTLQVYAGPEYSQVHDTLVMPLPGLGTLTARLYRVRTYPRLGGSLAHTGANLSWSLSAGSQVSNGGGAMPFPAEAIDVAGQIAPRLPPGWQLRLGARGAHLQALAGGGLSGVLWMGAGSADLTRDLTRHLSLEFEFDYTAQRGAGLLPMAPPVNRSLVTAGIRWSSTARPLADSGGNAQ